MIFYLSKLMSQDLIRWKEVENEIKINGINKIKYVLEIQMTYDKTKKK